MDMEIKSNCFGNNSNWKLMLPTQMLPVTFFYSCSIVKYIITILWRHAIFEVHV